jgi:hypothetical protein
MDEQAVGATALGILAVIAATVAVVVVSRSGIAPLWIALVAAFVAFLAAATVLAAVETGRR